MQKNLTNLAQKPQTVVTSDFISFIKTNKKNSNMFSFLVSVDLNKLFKIL